MQQAERFAIVALLATPDDAGEECLKVDKQVKGNVASTAKYVEQKTCDGCGCVFHKLFRCSCKLVRYCTVACQKRHWRTHRRDCPLHVRSSSNMSGTSRQSGGTTKNAVSPWLVDGMLSLEDLSFSMGASPQKIEDAFAKSGKKQKSKRR